MDTIFGCLQSLARFTSTVWLTDFLRFHQVSLAFCPHKEDKFPLCEPIKAQSLIHLEFHTQMLCGWVNATLWQIYSLWYFRMWDPSAAPVLWQHCWCWCVVYESRILIISGINIFQVFRTINYVNSSYLITVNRLYMELVSQESDFLFPWPLTLF